MKNKLLLVFIFSVLITFSQTKPLDRYIQIALKNHPKIQSNNLKYKAALKRVDESGNLKDIRFTIAPFLSSPQTKAGPQDLKLGVSQQFPWLGTLKAEKQVVKAKAEVQLETNRAYDRQIIFKTKSAYYNLAKIKQRIIILEKNLVIFNTYERLALGKLKNNLATMADVLKIRIKKNEINTQIKNEQSLLETEKRNFNRLLNRKIRTKIRIDSLTENIVLPSILNTAATFDNNPLINRFSKQREVINKTQLANKKERLPKIGFGLDYIVVSRLDRSSFADNGKDVVMPMVSLSIPLFNKKYKAKADRLQIENEMNLFAQQDELIALQKALDTARNKFEISKRKINTFNQNIKQAQRVEKLTLTNYTTDRPDYDEILKTQEIILAYRLSKINEISNLYEQKTLVEYLTTLQ